jgi:PAS domain S-box-containing protein
MPEEKRLKILIIDDDPLVMQSFLSLLNSDGYSAVGVTVVSKALTLLEREIFDIVITELIMEEMGGNELLSALLQKAPDIIVMILTGYGSIQMAMDAIRNGAYDYILKPCDYNVLKNRIDKAISTMKPLDGKKESKQTIGTSEEPYKIVLENINDLLLLFDKDRNCLYASPSWESQIGLSQCRLVDKNWMNLLSCEDRKKIERAFLALKTRKGPRQEFVINLNGKNKDIRTFKGYMIFIKNGVNQESRVFLILNDITKHMKIQAQEKEIERIKAAKDLAIATAHHVNQPMTCIRGLTEVMLKEPKSRNTVLEYLEQIMIQCDIVQDIIERLLNINEYKTVAYVDEEMLNLFADEEPV